MRLSFKEAIVDMVVSPASQLTKTIEEAWNISKLYGAIIRFEFNGKTVIVCRESDLTEVENAYWAKEVQP